MIKAYKRSEEAASRQPEALYQPGSEQKFKSIPLVTAQRCADNELPAGDMSVSASPADSMQDRSQNRDNPRRRRCSAQRNVEVCADAARTERPLHAAACQEEVCTGR